MRLLLFILIIVLFYAKQTVFSETCQSLLASLAYVQGEFIECNTKHSLPVKETRLCVGCKLKYEQMDEKYKYFMSFENCSKNYTDVDRINILSTTESVLTGLWSRAYCADCFVSQNWDNFNNLFCALKTCLSEYKNNSCIQCQGHYIKMNNFFKDLEKNNNGKVCFDMQDIMNKTRGKWSKELNCCQREVKMTTFVTSVFAVAVVPIILLYSGAFLLINRRESNHGMLNEQEPELDISSTTTIITAAVLSTPTEQSVSADVFNSISKVLATEDSEDESSTKAKTN